MRPSTANQVDFRLPSCPQKGIFCRRAVPQRLQKLSTNGGGNERFSNHFFMRLERGGAQDCVMCFGLYFILLFPPVIVIARLICCYYVGGAGCEPAWWNFKKNKKNKIKSGGWKWENGGGGGPPLEGELISVCLFVGYGCVTSITALVKSDIKLISTVPADVQMQAPSSQCG